MFLRELSAASQTWRHALVNAFNSSVLYSKWVVPMWLSEMQGQLWKPIPGQGSTPKVRNHWSSSMSRFINKVIKILTKKNMKRIQRRHFLTNDLHRINYAWIMNHQWNNQGAAKNGVLQDWCSRYNVTCSREAGCKSLFMNKMYQNGKSTLSSKYSHLYFSFVFFSKFSLMKIFYLYPQDDKDICYIKIYLT